MDSIELEADANSFGTLETWVSTIRQLIAIGLKLFVVMSCFELSPHENTSNPSAEGLWRITGSERLNKMTGKYEAFFGWPYFFVSKEAIVPIVEQSQKKLLLQAMEIRASTSKQTTFAYLCQNIDMRPAKVMMTISDNGRSASARLELNNLPNGRYTVLRFKLEIVDPLVLNNDIKQILADRANIPVVYKALDALIDLAL